MLFVSVTLGASLKDVSYSVKQNGIMVNIDYTAPISDDDIIGWKSDRGWVYLTLLGVRAPKGPKPKENFSGVVRKIVIDDFDESTQLAILVKKPILGYDIINSKTSPSTIVFIHTEMKKSEVASLKQHIKKEGSSVFNIAKSSGFPKYNTNFKNAFDEARKELGPNAIFEYHGKLYTTNHPGEKDALSRSILLDKKASLPSRKESDNFKLRKAPNKVVPGAKMEEVYVEKTTGEILTEKVDAPVEFESPLAIKNDVKPKQYNERAAQNTSPKVDGVAEPTSLVELGVPSKIDSLTSNSEPAFVESQSKGSRNKIVERFINLFMRNQPSEREELPRKSFQKYQKKYIPPVDEDIVVRSLDQNYSTESKTQESDTSFAVVIQEGNVIKGPSLEELQQKYIPYDNNKMAFNVYGFSDSLDMKSQSEPMTQSPDTNIVEAWFLDESIIPDEYDATRLQQKYIPYDNNKMAFNVYGFSDSLDMKSQSEPMTQSPDTNIVEAWFLDESIIPDEYDVTRLQQQYIPSEFYSGPFQFEDKELFKEPDTQTPEYTDPIVLDNRFKTRFKNNSINPKTHSEEKSLIINDTAEVNTWLSYFPFQHDSVKSSLKWDFPQDKEVPSFLQGERESLDYAHGNQDQNSWRSQLPRKKPKSFPKRQSDPSFMYYNNGGIKVESNLEGVPIYIDGKYVGETPISVPVEVEPGWHQVSGFSPMYTHLAARRGLQYVGYDSIIQNNESYGSTTVYSEPGKLETVVLKFNQMGDKPKKLSEIKGGMNIGLPMFGFIMGMIFWSM